MIRDRFVSELPVKPGQFLHPAQEQLYRILTKGQYPEGAYPLLQDAIDRYQQYFSHTKPVQT